MIYFIPRSFVNIVLFLFAKANLRIIFFCNIITTVPFYNGISHISQKINNKRQKRTRTVWIIDKE